MKKLYQRMERRFGRSAVPHLTFILIGCYVIGYVMELINPAIVSYMTLEPYWILHGQVWRLVTWVIIPPESFNIFTIIMLFFYLSIGVSLERAWGDFRYNFYVFGGFLITIITAFVCYIVLALIYSGQTVVFGGGGASPFSTYYICMSLFLAYAATFPEARVYLYFVLPIKVKWLGYLYAAFLAYDVITYIRLAVSGYPIYWVYCVAIVASLLNFVIFFFTTRDFRRYSPKEVKRRRDWKKAANENSSRGRSASGPVLYKGNRTQGRQGLYGQNGQNTQVPRHRCEICGRTDITNPELEFRYCTKCKGDHEYCMDHLYNHTHVE